MFELLLTNNMTCPCYISFNASPPPRQNTHIASGAYDRRMTRGHCPPPTLGGGGGGVRAKTRFVPPKKKKKKKSDAMNRHKWTMIHDRIGLTPVLHSILQIIWNKFGTFFTFYLLIFWLFDDETIVFALYTSMNFSDPSKPDRDAEPGEGKRAWPAFTIPELQSKELSLEMGVVRAVRAAQCHFWNEYFPELAQFAGERSTIFWKDWNEAVTKLGLSV